MWRLRQRVRPCFYPVTMVERQVIIQEVAKEETKNIVILEYENS
jgi:hypothetical protein